MFTQRYFTWTPCLYGELGPAVTDEQEQALIAVRAIQATASTASGSDTRRRHRDETGDAHPGRMTNAAENRDIVRAALEQVCARGDMALAPSCYAEGFVDHVGRLEYRGLDGVRRSTALYRALFDD